MSGDEKWVDETWTEHLRSQVRKFIDADCPYGQGHGDVVEMFAMLPPKVREAIFLLVDGHAHQVHRAHLKGARTARARRKGAA